MPRVTVLQQRVQQHRAQRRRKRHRQARLHAVALPAFHHLDQRDVSFGDGLEEPVFLQKLLVFRMADERQVRVQDEGEMALHGEISPDPLSNAPPAPGFPVKHQPGKKRHGL